MKQDDIEQNMLLTCTYLLIVFKIDTAAMIMKMLHTILNSKTYSTLLLNMYKEKKERKKSMRLKIC